jgi:hypothetical protein
MSPTRISIDLYCELAKSPRSSYRLFVDGELLTERSWIWPTYETYIKENIEVIVSPGKHTVRVDRCWPDCKFGFKNLYVNEQLVNSDPKLVQELTFTV